MEKNKYYTPDIEEFHVGFEYEEQVEPGKWKWCRCVDGSFDKLGEFAFRSMLEIRTRVKHLDQEDIESLGWRLIQDETLNKNELVFVRGGRRTKHIILCENNLVVIGYKVFPRGEKSTDNNHRGYGQIFKGTIKNKSELKRILKQIGYED